MRVDALIIFIAGDADGGTGAGFDGGEVGVGTGLFSSKTDLSTGPCHSAIDTGISDVFVNADDFVFVENQVISD
ncbi:MAG: hypothetical protein ACYC26_12400 [Phycisphaerales bacterium]